MALKGLAKDSGRRLGYLWGWGPNPSIWAASILGALDSCVLLSSRTHGTFLTDFCQSGQRASVCASQAWIPVATNAPPALKVVLGSGRQGSGIITID